MERSPQLTVQVDPALDVGFHVAAHLDMPDVAISVFDRQYVEQVAAGRAELGIQGQLLGAQAGRLCARLNRRWLAHQLVRVPALFSNFEDTKVAFDVLLEGTAAADNDTTVILQLERFFYPLYPNFRNLAQEDRELGQALVELIVHEYETFYPAFHQLHRQTWENARRRFADAWQRDMAPAMAILDPTNQIEEVVIVLSPALRRHGKSYRIFERIGRVATHLPQTPEELEHSLFYAFHEMCHGVSDPLIYELGYERRELSYKEGEPGKRIHILIEATANQAMFEALGRTNPGLQEKFVARFGDLRWLARDRLLEERIALAGRKVPERHMERLRKDLTSSPLVATQRLYEEGLLVPETAVRRLREIVSR